MPFNIYIDNCVWDFLFDRKLDLAIELPQEEFRVSITREAEFEIAPIKRAEVRAFAKDTIAKCKIESDSFFGLSDESLPLDEQRISGLGEGRLASAEESAFIDGQQNRIRGKKRPTKLFPNEADVSLAARSFHAIVLTAERRKPGALKDAYDRGGDVVFLEHFDKSGKSLSEFIKSAYRARNASERP